MGIGEARRHVIFFEGEEDHRIPLHDQALRCTELFKGIGRIVGRSFIHGYWALTAPSGNDDGNQKLFQPV